MRLVIAVVCSVAASVAHSDTPVPATPATGFWLHGAFGYPTFGAVGVGYRCGSGTEIMANVGILPLFVVWGFSGELAANQDIARAGRIAFHVGIHTAVLLVTAPPDGGVETRQRWLGPRLGIKVRVANGFWGVDLGPSLILGDRKDSLLPRSNDIGLSAILRFRG